MNEQDSPTRTSPRKLGGWANIVADFRELWTIVTAGFVAGCAIAGISGAMSHAAFSGGHQSYGFAYLGTALFIAFGLPAALFLMQRRKG